MKFLNRQYLRIQDFSILDKFHWQFIFYLFASTLKSVIKSIRYAIWNKVSFSEVFNCVSASYLYLILEILYIDFFVVEKIHTHIN